jgi:hypothetical protein
VLLLLLEPLPLGVAEPLTLPLPDTLPDGEVVLLLLPLGLVVVDDELELLSEERGVVAVPGDADGLVRSDGVVVTRSLSVRLHAVRAPPTSARAQRPESTLFIADAPPCGVLRPSPTWLQRPCPRRPTVA